jgi:chromosome segregation ATPase
MLLMPAKPKMTLDRLAAMVNEGFKEQEASITARITANLTAKIEESAAHVMSVLGAKIGKLEIRVTALEKRMESIEKRMNSMESRMASLEHRVDRLEHKFEQLFEELFGIKDHLKKVTTEEEFKKLKKRVLVLERKVGVRS